MSRQRSPDIPFLGEDEVRAHLRFEDLIPAMERALRDYSAGRITQPDRRMLPVAPSGGFFGVMPAVGGIVGLKTVCFFPGNAALGLPTHLATIQLFSPETGKPLVVMDGRLITEMRTAAVSAAVLEHVLTGREDTLAIFGNGVQAHVHAAALRHVHDFRDIRVWGRARRKAEAFAADIGGRAVAAAEAAAGADVVVTATSSREPVLNGAWLKDGAVVCAVGWNSRDGRELDDAAMRNVVVVESRSGTSQESGNIRGAKAEIFAEAGELLSGSKTIPPGATVVFDSIGMACEDLYAAGLVWESWQAGR